MSRILTWTIAAVLIVGGIASWNLIPESWFDRFPEWVRIALVTCAIIFSGLMILGHVLDSGLLQRIFKKKQP
jgi:cytochrome bd-type quinol oxidase subunit 1